MKFRSTALVALALLGTIPAANAANFVGFDPAGSPFSSSNSSYSTFQASLAAYGAYGVEDFESYSFFSPSGFYTAAPLGITFSTNWSGSGHPSPIPLAPFPANGFDSQKLNGNVTLNDVFAFTSPIRAFGTYISNIGDDDNITTLSVTLDLNGGDVRTYNIPYTFQTGPGLGYNATAFIGFTNEAPFNNVTIVRGGSNGPDILTYDNVTVSAVPEPGTWAMMASAIGMAGIYGLRRRRAVLA